jgi:DNA-directed RNA polymerase subunit M/transcription elongation factor TFIIS
LITGWLAPDDCPDCGGPLLDTSTDERFLVLDCPGCGYHTRWHLTDHGPDNPDPDDPDMEAE